MERGSPQPIELFYCYARKDRDLRNELDAHLAVLRHSGLITTWYDGEISPGVAWEKEVEKRLASAHIILLLISADFIKSPYCWSNEMERAIERHQANEARVIPVLLRNVDWTGTPFSTFQMLPSNAQAVTSWPNRDDAFENVAKGVRQVVDDRFSQDSISSQSKSSQAPVERPSRSEVTAEDFSNPTLSADKFQKWLKRTKLRPNAYKGEVCRGICTIDNSYSTAISTVIPIQARQFPGKGLKAGNSVRCTLNPVADGYHYIDCCFANGDIAEQLCEATKKDRLMVTVECLGQLKEYSDVVRANSLGDDDDERDAEYCTAYLIISLDILSQEK